MITIIAVGKKHDDWVSVGIERYQKRLQQPYNIEWQLLPHSSLEGDSARREESERIRNRIDDAAFVVLMDERGEHIDSVSFSKVIEERLVHSTKILFIIGGAYGVDDSIRQRTDKVISLSELVFPHQMVRLILIEQLYRAQEIARGGKYHHS